MKAILSSSFEKNGSSFEEFCEDRKRFEESTFRWQNNFRDVDFALWIFRSVTNDNKIQALKVAEDIVEAIGTWTFDSNKKIVNQAIMDGNKLPDEILDDIKEKSIPMAIEYGKHFFFVDSNCLSRFCAKLGVSTKLIYQNNYIGGLVLWHALKNYHKDLTLNVRCDKGYRKVVNVISEKTIYLSAIDVVKNIHSVTNYVFSYYAMTQYTTSCFLDGPVIDGTYIPSIRMEFSDTGHGDENFYFCLRPVEMRGSPSFGIIIKKLKKADVNEISNIEKMVTERIRKIRLDYTAVVFDKEKFLENQDILKAIGQKRMRNISMRFDGQNCCEAMKIISMIPVLIGKINDTSDYALMISAGNFFMHFEI